MALSRIGGSSVASTSITIPTHLSGDILIIWAYRDGVTTPPTVPTAGGTVPSWTTIDGPTGANLNSAVCAWAIGTGSSTSGTWTNATGMSVEVWRGQKAATPIGGHAQSGGAVASGASLVVPAITQTDATGASVLLAFAGWRTVTAWSAPPTGYTQRSSVATETEAVTKDTTTSDGTFNLTGTASASGGYRTQYVEILVAAGGGGTFTDSGSGTITLAGTRTESRVGSDSRAGTLTLGGTKTATTVYTSARTATITLGGTRTAAQTHASSRSGTLTLGGTRTASQTHTASRSGSITLGGSRTETRSYVDTRSGTITLLGTGSASNTTATTKHHVIYIRFGFY